MLGRVVILSGVHVLAFASMRAQQMPDRRFEIFLDLIFLKSDFREPQKQRDLNRAATVSVCRRRNPVSYASRPDTSSLCSLGWFVWHVVHPGLCSDLTPRIPTDERSLLPP